MAAFAIGAAGPARRDRFQKSQRESCSQYESRNHLMTSAFFTISTTRCIYSFASLPCPSSAWIMQQFSSDAAPGERPMPADLRRAARALLSVSVKTGLAGFARGLAGFGVELVSTGGTRKALADAGLPVRDVADLTGFPELLGGRVKTLHPKVHGGLLAIRENPEHEAAMLAHGIAPIDLLVVNLYPFEATIGGGAGFADCIEYIDIGGPAMIRAAAKNYNDVAVVVDPGDYPKILGDLTAHGGCTTRKLRQELAQKAFARTAVYDAAISNWLAAG